MLKILLIIFVIIPFSIWVGTMIANLVSLILMFIAVAIGGVAHNLFRGKVKDKWQPPDFIKVSQFLIIYGFILSVYANVIGQSFHWNTFTHLGRILQGVFLVFLVIDLLVLMLLATIHGRFDFIED